MRANRVVICACAASAGAHAGLVPEHLREAAPLGVSFIVSVVLLLAVGLALALRPENVRVAQAAALLFAGLILAFVASRTTGLPLLQPHPEAMDPVGLATKLVEAVGLAFALGLTHPLGGHRSPAIQEATR